MLGFDYLICRAKSWATFWKGYSSTQKMFSFATAQLRLPPIFLPTFFLRASVVLKRVFDGRWMTQIERR